MRASAAVVARVAIFCGAAVMPGTWHIFFEQVVLGIARSEAVLTLPLAVHVDDTGLIGADCWSECARGARRETSRS